MNFCHMIAGYVPPNTLDPADVGHRVLRARRIAHPDDGDELRRVAGEPRVLGVVARPGLAGQRPVGELRVGRRALGDVGQHVGDGPRDLRGELPLAAGRPVDDAALGCPRRG